MKTHSFVEEIITSSNEVFNDFESDMAGEIRTLSDPFWGTSKDKDTVKQNAGC